MNKEIMKGIFTALLTPYGKDGIDRQALQKLIDFNIAAGVNGFYVGGSTGEGVMFSAKQRKQLFSAVAEANAGRKLLIGHVGSTSTEEAVLLAAYASDAGYDAVSAVAPFYYSYNYDAVKQYYFDIAAASKVPLIVYNYPLSGTFSLTPQKAADLMKNEKIIGIKHTSQDLYMISMFKEIENTPVVYNGYDEMLLAGLVMGADGGIGSTYNFMPHKIVKLYQTYLRGDLKEAERMQKEINLIISQVIAASERCGIMNCEKAILTSLGIPMGQSLKPFLATDESVRRKMSEIAEKLLPEVEALL